MVLPGLPLPADKGTHLRNWGLWSRLARRHAVVVVAPAAAGTQVPQALRDCMEVVTVPAHAASAWHRGRALLEGHPDLLLRSRLAGIEAAVKGAVRRHAPDVIAFEGLETTLGLHRLRAKAGRVGLLYDAHNVESLLQARARDADRRVPARWAAAAYSHVQSLRLRRHEHDVCRLVDQVTCVSPVDAARLAVLGVTAPPVVVPSGADLVDARASDGRAPSDIVFVGGLDYRPNRDAVRWLIEAIYPRVRRAVPSARLRIVGADPPRWLTGPGVPDGVVVTGRVDDARAVVACAAVSVAPLRIGSGTRLKVLEALSLGVPVVSTALGVEGLALADGVHVLIADDADAFAQAVVRLLTDPTAQATLGAAGRQAVRTHYDWEGLWPAMEAALGAALDAGRRRSAATRR